MSMPPTLLQLRYFMLEILIDAIAFSCQLTHVLYCILQTDGALAIVVVKS